MVKGDDPEEIMKDYPFSVVSFYNPLDPKSVKVDALLDKVNKDFHRSMSNMQTEIRTVGWFRVNLGETPELSIAEDIDDKPTVVVFGPGMSKKTHFEMQPGDEDENVKTLLSIVEELTGNWFSDGLRCLENI